MAKLVAIKFLIDFNKVCRCCPINEAINPKREYKDRNCRKIGMKLSVINRLRNELNCNQKLMIYRTVVYSPNDTKNANTIYIFRSQRTKYDHENF